MKLCTFILFFLGVLFVEVNSQDLAVVHDEGRSLVTYNESSSEDEKENEVEIGSWDIRNGILIETASKNTQKAKERWKVFYSIFPKKITQKYIKKITLFTDGVDEKTGALASLNVKNDEWQLSLDVTDVDFESKSKERVFQSIYTYLHEFGHLLTLNNTQIKPTKKRKQEEGEPYLTFEGETLKNSYMNKFVKRFWSGGLLNEWDVIQKKYCVTEHKKCIDKLYDLYKDNYTDFLTDYAAESPEEDIVESWTAFVLYDKVKNPETVAEQKINFFYQFPKLVKFRKIIKRNIKHYLE